MAQQNSANELFSRVFSYPAVMYVSDTVKGYYAYAKERNSYVKVGLETAESYSQPILHKVEEYSHQPTIESLLHKVDQYGCKQLDKIEYGGKQIKQTYETVKPKTLQSLDTVANKIHGSSVEAIILKTANLVDIVVDSLLPPDPTEPVELTHIPTDPNVLTRTTPIINKLRTRVTLDSILRLPYTSYYVGKDFLFRGADAIPQLHYCIGVLTAAAHKVQDASSSTSMVAKSGFQKGQQISKASVEYVYQSLHHMVAALTSLVVLIKKLDTIEAKATLEELTVLIQKSKDKYVHKQIDKWETAVRLKEDISTILQKAGDLLSEQLVAGYTRVHASDNAAIRKSVETIETIVLRIIDRVSLYQQQGQPSQQPNGHQ